MKIDENVDTQETEQDPREKMRQDYRDMVENENAEDDNNVQVDVVETDETTLEAGETEQTETAETPEPVDEAIELPELTPHNLWPEDFKEKFATMPREAQQLMIETQSNMQKGLTQKFQELGEQRRGIEAIEQAYQPLETYARTNGIQTSQIAIQAAQHIQNIIQDPIPGAKGFLAAMGVDINTLIENEEYIDPQYAAITQELQQLKQRDTQQQQQAYQQSLATAQQQLNAFINETNEQGHLKHERFEELRQTMHMYYQQDKQTGQPEKPLNQYYAMAERFTAAQAPPQDPHQIQSQSPNAIQKAKVASKNIQSKTNTKAPAKLSQRDEIRAAYRAMGGV